MQQALDACTTRLRHGESLEGCLSAFPELRADLRPLLEVAEALTGRHELTTPPGGLRRGRARLLARAAALRSGTVDSCETVDALDRALAPLIDASSALVASQNGEGAAPLSRPTFGVAPARHSTGGDRTITAVERGASIDAELGSLVDVAQRLRAALKPAPSVSAQRMAADKMRLIAAAKAMAERNHQVTETKSTEAKSTEANGTAANGTAANGTAANGTARLVLSANGALAGSITAALDQALDGVLDQVRGGVSPHDAMAAYRDRPEIAAALAPLVQLAETITLSTRDVPDARDALARSRTHFFNSIAAARAVSSAVQPEGATAWTSSAAAASAIRADAVAAPPAPYGLRPGRERLLRVAAAQRRKTATTTPSGWRIGLATVRGWMPRGGLLAGPRAALIAAGVLFVLIGANALAYPAYANMLPGDSFYAIKSIARQTRLVFAGAVAPVSPRISEDWRGQIQRDMVGELIALQESGRREIVELQGRLATFQEQGGRDERAGTITVAIAGEQPHGREQLVVVEWNEHTRFRIPDAYGAMPAVPQGAPLGLDVQTGSNIPRALSVRVGLLSPTVALTATATAMSTAMPHQSPDPSATTQPATATFTTTATAASTATLLPTPTVALTPTSTVTPSPMPTATPGTRPNSSVERPDFAVMSGYIVEVMYDEAASQVILVLQPEADSEAVRVKIDVTAIAGNPRYADEWARAVPGAFVTLEVERRDDHALIIGRGLAGRIKPPSCKNEQVTGFVQEYVAGERLVLVDGNSFGLGGLSVDDIEGQPTTSERIVVDFENCGLGGIRVRRLRVPAEPNPGQSSERLDLAGEVEAIDTSVSPAILRLVTRRHGTWTIEFEGDVVTPGLESLQPGAMVAAEVQVLDAGNLRALALRIRVLAAPPPSPPLDPATPTSAVPIASATPSSSAAAAHPSGGR